MPQQDTLDQAITTASSYRQRRDQGTLWNAPSGAVVRVRTLDITDHAILGQFPDYLRKIIYGVIEKSSALRTAPDEDLDLDPFAGLSGEELLDREMEIGVTLCKLGWIEPQVVDEVTDPDRQIATTEIDAQDRRAYMGWVFNVTQAEAQQLATFPEQPRGSVGAGPALSAVPSDAESAAAAGGTRVLRSDGV